MLKVIFGLIVKMIYVHIALYMMYFSFAQEMLLRSEETFLLPVVLANNLKFFYFAPKSY